MDFKVLAEQYRSELFDSVLPFWLKNSQDKEYGGYFSCLDRDGSVYDTDKFVWLQGREIWLFSMLYNKVENRIIFSRIPLRSWRSDSCISRRVTRSMLK